MRSQFVTSKSELPGFGRGGGGSFDEVFVAGEGGEGGELGGTVGTGHAGMPGRWLRVRKAYDVVVDMIKVVHLQYPLLFAMAANSVVTLYGSCSFLEVHTL